MEHTDILYIDHDRHFARQTEILLKTNGFKVYTVNDYGRTCSVCRKISPHLLLLELESGNTDKLEQIEIIKKQNKELPIVIYSSYTDPDVIAQANDIGIEAYIHKDCNIRIFISKLKNIFRQHRNNLQHFFRISAYTQFDYTTAVLTIKGNKIKLKPTDARLLKLLCSRLNEYADSDYLCQGMWNITGKKDELRRYVRHLRQLLCTDESIRIENHWGGSYSLKASH